MGILMRKMTEDDGTNHLHVPYFTTASSRTIRMIHSEYQMIKACLFSPSSFSLLSPDHCPCLVYASFGAELKPARCRRETDGMRHWGFDDVKVKAGKSLSAKKDRQGGLDARRAQQPA